MMRTVDVAEEHASRNRKYGMKNELGKVGGGIGKERWKEVTPWWKES